MSKKDGVVLLSISSDTFKEIDFLVNEKNPWLADYETVIKTGLEYARIISIASNIDFKEQLRKHNRKTTKTTKKRH